MAPGRSRLDFDGSLLWFMFNPWSWDLWPEKKKKKGRRLAFCFPKPWCDCGLSADGVGGGSRGERMTFERLGALSFPCPVLFTLVRLI